MAKKKALSAKVEKVTDEPTRKRLPRRVGPPILFPTERTSIPEEQIMDAIKRVIANRK